WASISVPTLEDLPKMPVVVYGATSCCQASLTVTPDMRIEPGTWCTSSGVVRPYSMAAAAVTILFTEPGSNGSLIDGLPVRAQFFDSSMGLKVLSLAMASTCPVLASSTTAEAAEAPER